MTFTAAARSLLLAALLLVALGAGAADRPATPWGEASAETFAAAYQAAQTARARAAELANEWRDIAPLLRDAEALARQGQYDEATALAEQALFQAERARAQAVEQAARWRSYVVQ